MGKRVKTTSEPSSFSFVNPDAAGLDIGASEIYVAVPPERDEPSVRAFPTFTPDQAYLPWEFSFLVLRREKNPSWLIMSNHVVHTLQSSFGVGVSSHTSLCHEMENRREV